MMRSILLLAFVAGCSVSAEPEQTTEEETTESVEQGATTGTWRPDSWESCGDMCGGSCSCLSPRTSTDPNGKRCAPLGARTWYIRGSQARLFFCQ